MKFSGRVSETKPTLTTLSPESSQIAEKFRKYWVDEENFPLIKDVTEYIPVKKGTSGWSTRKGIDRIVVHCTDSVSSAIDTAEYHISDESHIKNMKSIAYHGFVETDGTCLQNLEYNKYSWHVGIWNSTSLAIAMQYRATGAKNAPSEKIYKSMSSYCAAMCLGLGVSPSQVVGHRELQFTGWINSKDNLVKTCPGKLADMDLIRRRTAKKIQKFLSYMSVMPYTGKIDGVFGPKSQASFDAFVNNEMNRLLFMAAVHEVGTEKDAK